MWSFYPVFCLILMMIWLMYLTASSRFKASKSGEITAKTIKYVLSNDMPNNMVLKGNNYDNLFQQPVVFGLLMLSLFNLQFDHLILQILAWGFVLLRIWHSYEHVSGRNLMRRTWAFFLSSVCHWLAWLVFAGLVIAKTGF